MTPSPSPASQAGEPRRPRSAQTVSVNISDGSSQGQSAGRRFQLQVSECVETKTVTTTTRLTRKFPQVFVRDPTPLAGLDTKEYPLATKPTPPELLGFQYNMPDDEMDYDDADVDDVALDGGAVGPVSLSPWSGKAPSPADTDAADEADHQRCNHAHGREAGASSSRNACPGQAESSTYPLSLRGVPPTHADDTCRPGRVPNHRGTRVTVHSLVLLPTLPETRSVIQPARHLR